MASARLSPRRGVERQGRRRREEVANLRRADEGHASEQFAGQSRGVGDGSLCGIADEEHLPRRLIAGFAGHHGAGNSFQGRRGTFDVDGKSRPFRRSSFGSVQYAFDQRTRDAQVGSGDQHLEPEKTQLQQGRIFARKIENLFIRDEDFPQNDLVALVPPRIEVPQNGFRSSPAVSAGIVTTATWSTPNSVGTNTPAVKRSIDAVRQQGFLLPLRSRPPGTRFTCMSDARMLTPERPSAKPEAIRRFCPAMNASSPATRSGSSSANPTTLTAEKWCMVVAIASDGDRTARARCTRTACSGVAPRPPKRAGLAGPARRLCGTVRSPNSPISPFP